MKYCPRCAALLSRQSVEGRERVVCAADGCGFVFYDNPLPVVAAIVEHDDGVILVRNHGWPEKMFGLVTGFLEKGESPEAATLRELDEELGLSGEIVRLIGVYPFEQRNEVIIAYHVRARGTVRLGEELAQFKTVAKDKLRPWPFGTGLAVSDWLAQK